MNKSTYITTRFDVCNGFYVEVTPYTCDKEEWLAFTLCRDGYGCKSFMFGLKRKDTPEHMWEDIILSNIRSYTEFFYEDIKSLER